MRSVLLKKPFPGSPLVQKDSYKSAPKQLLLLDTDLVMTEYRSYHFSMKLKLIISTSVTFLMRKTCIKTVLISLLPSCKPSGQV